MAVLKQNTAYVREFKMISSTDHVSLKTGAAPVVGLSKAGAAFAPPAGAVSEIGNGWYQVALTVADTGTLGDLSFYITGTGADDTDFVDQVTVLGSAPIVGGNTGGAGQLTAYLTTTRNYLHDPGGFIYSQTQLTAYINQARGQVAAITGCCRTLQIVNTVVGQETYPLPAINGNGLAQVIAVMGISCPWGGALKPTLDREPWSALQALYRSFSGLVTGFPSVWAQYGDAVGGQVYMFPIPSQVLASEWDCIASVLPLASDADPEMIPFPFTDAVPMYAAWQALIGASRYQDAQSLMAMYRQVLMDARASTTPVFVSSAY